MQSLLAHTVRTLILCGFGFLGLACAHSDEHSASRACVRAHTHLDGGLVLRQGGHQSPRLALSVLARTAILVVLAWFHEALLGMLGS